jgi:hypothetical protein
VPDTRDATVSLGEAAVSHMVLRARELRATFAIGANNTMSCLIVFGDAAPASIQTLDDGIRELYGWVILHENALTDVLPLRSVIQ